jgi:hypothetical protein
MLLLPIVICFIIVIHLDLWKSIIAWVSDLLQNNISVYRISLVKEFKAYSTVSAQSI